VRAEEKLTAFVELEAAIFSALNDEGRGQDSGGGSAGVLGASKTLIFSRGVDLMSKQKQKATRL
jgi:hypothetical protein